MRLNRLKFQKYSKYLLFSAGVIFSWLLLQIIPLFFSRINTLMPFGPKLMIMQHSLFFVCTVGIFRLPRAAFYPVLDDADWRPLPFYALVFAHLFSTFFVCYLSFLNVDDQALSKVSSDFNLFQKLEEKKFLENQDIARLEELYSEAIFKPKFNPFKNMTLERMSLDNKQQTLLNKNTDDPAFFRKTINEAALENLSRFDKKTLEKIDKTAKRILSQTVQGDWVKRRIEKDIRNGVLSAPSEIWNIEVQKKNIGSIKPIVKYYAVRNEISIEELENIMQKTMIENVKILDDNFWKNYSKLKAEADKYFNINNMSTSERVGMLLGKATKQVADSGSRLFEPITSTLSDFKTGLDKGLVEE